MSMCYKKDFPKPNNHRKRDAVTCPVIFNMFDAYLDFLSKWYDWHTIENDALYWELIDSYLEMGDKCGESTCNFILNTAMETS